MSSGRPTYFGDERRPLFGVLDVPPSGLARGAVVLCPPVGKEQGDTTRGQRLLAQELCARGIAVLRYDHLHTGESWGGQSDPEAGSHLVPGLRAAIDLVRTAGAPRVAVVGQRVGALVAAQLDVDDLGGLSALLLWDPVLRGSSYVRGERAMHQVAFDQPSDDGDLVHLIGATWHRTAIEHVASLAVKPAVVAAVGGPVAVATSSPDAAAVAKLAAAGADVLEVVDQATFVKPDSFYVELPVTTVDALTAWLEPQFGPESRPFVPTLRRSATMSRGGAPIEVRTTVAVTATGVVVWETAPVGVPVTRTLVTHGTANDTRTGPARLWAEAAVELAAEGVRTLRHDRRGVGESGVVERVGDYAPIHSRESVDDARSVLAVFGLDAPLGGSSAAAPSITGGPGGTVVHAGVCSGGWVAAAVAHEAARPSSIVLVNHLMWRLQTESFSHETLVRMGVADSGQEGATAWHRWKGRLQPHVTRVLPGWAWTLLGHARMAQVPSLLLRDLARDDLRTHLVFADSDHALFLRQRGGEALRSLSRRGWSPHVTVTGTGDHAALLWTVREAALAACRQELGLTPPHGHASATRAGTHQAAGAGRETGVAGPRLEVVGAHRPGGPALAHFGIGHQAALEGGVTRRSHRAVS